MIRQATRSLSLPLLLLVMLAGLLLGGYVVWSLPRAWQVPLRPDPVVSVSAQWLHGEDLMFMVTNRVVTQVMVEQKQDSLLAGRREGMLVATVRLYYGVDMQSITNDDIHDRQNQVLVVIPRPRLLDFAIDPNFRIITKRSGVNVVLDWFSGQDIESELRLQIQETAMTFAGENDLLPKPQAVLTRLNRYAALLSEKAGKKVQFVYELPDDAPSEPSGEALTPEAAHP